MNMTIRPMKKEDTQAVIDMMRVFYTSPAVLSNGSEEIFRSDVENCVNDSPYLEGYVFEKENRIQGYAMLAKSFSTEFGKPCIWIEDLYISEECRGMGIAGHFFEYIEAKYKDVVFRLESEEENERALKAYRKVGYRELPYLEMVKQL